MTTGKKPVNEILTDPYGRTITNVRIALTNACNLRFIYCHHEGEEINGCSRNDTHIQMTKEEIAELIGVFAELGVTTIKLTGGGPPLRSEPLYIIRSLPPPNASSVHTH